MPDESNELYKRNSIKPDYPEELGKGDSVEGAVTDIENSLESRFDVVVTNNGIRNGSRFVKAYSIEDTPDELFSDKITDGSEDRISAYINSGSRHIIRIMVPDNADARISMMVINSAHMPFQVLVECKARSRLSLFEYYCSAASDKHYVSPLHEFVLGNDSTAEFSMINNKAEGSSMVGFSKAHVSQGACLNANHIYDGSSFTKMKSEFSALGEKSRIDAREIVVGSADQKFDINTFIFNEKPNTYARLESGAVLDGRAFCMLKGYAKVAKLAKGATSRVEEHGILMSESAHIDALPDMAIDYSDGVSATHAAATAPIDKDALFYMMSRGIDSKESRKLFVSAFISKYLSGINNPFARELATSLLVAKADNGTFGELPEISMKDIWSANR